MRYGEVFRLWGDYINITSHHNQITALMFKSNTFRAQWSKGSVFRCKGFRLLGPFVVSSNPGYPRLICFWVYQHHPRVLRLTSKNCITAGFFPISSWYKWNNVQHGVILNSLIHPVMAESPLTSKKQNIRLVKDRRILEGASVALILSRICLSGCDLPNI